MPLSRYCTLNVVVRDEEAGEPRREAFSHARRVGEIEADFHIGLIIDDGEIPGALRHDRQHHAGRFVIGADEVAEDGFNIALRGVYPRPLLVEREEIALNLRLVVQELEEATHQGRTRRAVRGGQPGEGGATETDRVAGRMHGIRGGTVEIEVAVECPLPEDGYVRFIPDLEPPRSDRVQPEARITNQRVEEIANERLPVIERRGRQDW